MEEIFADHIARINDEFESKTMEYDRIRQQLIINFEWLKQYKLEMEGKLKEMYDEIFEERAIWEKEKEELKGMINLDSEVVPINVGGTLHMMTERDVLRQVPNSLLAKMFNGMHELKQIEGEYFLDRDGQTFLHVVNFLRNDRTVYPEFADRNDEIHFFKELDHWGIPVRPGMKKPYMSHAPAQAEVNVT